MGSVETVRGVSVRFAPDDWPSRDNLPLTAGLWSKAKSTGGSMREFVRIAMRFALTNAPADSGVTIPTLNCVPRQVRTTSPGATAYRARSELSDTERMSSCVRGRIRPS